MKNHIFRRGLALRFTPTVSSYDQKIIKKSLKQPIFVNSHHDEFVQCVSTNLELWREYYNIVAKKTTIYFT